jgi:hypothetical protein
MEEAFMARSRSLSALKNQWHPVRFVGPPALRRNRFCFFHKRFQDERICSPPTAPAAASPPSFSPSSRTPTPSRGPSHKSCAFCSPGRSSTKPPASCSTPCKPPASNLRLANFKPNTNDVILDPRDAANTPLDSHIWEDEDFAEEEDEVETAADRAIAALETVRKEKAEEEKWMRWAEMQYPDPRKQIASAVTPNGKAVVTASESVPGTTTKDLPLPNLKKPASSSSAAEIHAELSNMVRINCSPPWPRNSSPPKNQQTNRRHSQKRRPHNRKQCSKVVQLSSAGSLP